MNETRQQKLEYLTDNGYLHNLRGELGMSTKTLSLLTKLPEDIHRHHPKGCEERRYWKRDSFRRFGESHAQRLQGTPSQIQHHRHDRHSLRGGNQMSNDIVEVPFNGSMMIAQRFDDGEIYTALKPICENIGIAFNGQRERLNRTPWAVVRMIRTTGADGKRYDMMAVSRKTLTMWLATIDTSRLKDEHARRNVTVYQQEAAEALDKYFNEGGAIRVSDADSDEDIMARAVLVAQKTIEHKNRQIAEKDAQIKVLEPKALFADAVAASDGTCLVGELAKMLRQNGLNIGQNRLFQLLRDDGFFGKSGSNRNVPTQKAMDLGLFRIKETAVTHSDGHVTISRTPKVTGKGQRYFIARYCPEKKPND